jgi:hypothetical protein
MQKDKNIYDLSPDLKVTIDLLQKVLSNYNETNTTLIGLINEMRRSREKQRSQYESLKSAISETTTVLEKALGEKTCKIESMLVRNEELHIGSTLGEIGGLKKDISEIFKKINTKTPWYTIVGGLAGILGMFVTALLIAEKITALFK